MIITAYLPIFTLQSVEGRLFKPMAWMVSFALLGALVFSLLLAPVLASLLFPNGASEWENPVMGWLTSRYRHAVKWAIEHRFFTVGLAGLTLLLAGFLGFSGVIGSEFLPHLDEGSIWVRGTLAPSTGPTESLRIMNEARLKLAAFPEVLKVVSQTGRPDDGTDTTGFFNTEYFVDLKPKDQWRPVFKEDKEELIAAMDRELEKTPGVLWNFSQPISDNVEEAVSGVKGELAVKIYGEDLRTLEEKGNAIVSVMSKIQGVQDLGLFRVIGQPNLDYTVNREAAARYGINVADVQDAIQTAVGGNAVTQVLQGEARYDLVVRYLPQFRSTQEAIDNIRLPKSERRERVSLAQLTTIKTEDGAEEVSREGGQRHVAIKYSVRNRDLGSTVEEAIHKVNQQVKLPPIKKIDWAGEYESQKRSSRRLMLVLPVTILIIFVILFSPVSLRQNGPASSSSMFPWRLSAACLRSCLRILTSASPLEWVSSHSLASPWKRASSCSSTSTSCASVAIPSKSQPLRRGVVPSPAPHHDDDAGCNAQSFACGYLAWYRFGFAASGFAMVIVGGLI